MAQRNFNPEDAKEIASSFHELGNSYQEFGKILKQTTKETKDLKPLIGKRGEAKLEDSLLIKAGLALVLFPDPTISDIVGYAMITAGYMKNKSKRNTAASVYVELNNVTKDLQELTLDFGR